MSFICIVKSLNTRFVKYALILIIIPLQKSENAIITRMQLLELMIKTCLSPIFSAKLHIIHAFTSIIRKDEICAIDLRWMDFFGFYRPFNNISVISGCWREWGS